MSYSAIKTWLEGELKAIEKGGLYKGEKLINTPQGPLTATVDDSTTIVMFTEGSLVDLGIGIRVAIGGQRGEDGNVVAQSVTVLPEGLGNLAGGFGGRSGQLGGT